MTQLEFKSNIKCGGCISTVQPELNNLPGVESWEVDILHPDKILTVRSSTGDAQSVIDALKAVGYQAELVQSH